MKGAAMRATCAVCGDSVLCACAQLGHKRMQAHWAAPVRAVCATCAEAITAAWARAEGWRKAKKELENDDKH